MPLSSLALNSVTYNVALLCDWEVDPVYVDLNVVAGYVKDDKTA